MKQWWQRQHHATRESVIMGICAAIALFSLLIYIGDGQHAQNNARLFQAADVCRVSSVHGDYSLIFSYKVPLIGDNQFNPLGRLKVSEADTIRNGIFETVCIRHLGSPQLDQEQQSAYGFNAAVSVIVPGQAEWQISTGRDGLGYARDPDGNLFQLDRDLASQLNRSPEALRAISLGLPHDLLRIQHGKQWTLAHFRGHWWVNRGELSTLADQDISRDWIKVFQDLKAISFADSKADTSPTILYFEGQIQGRKQIIALRDCGPGGVSPEFRIIERQQQFDDFLLKEAYLMKIDKQLFDYPAEAFLSKNLIPVSFDDVSAIQLGTVMLDNKQGHWFVDQHIYAEQAAVGALLDRLKKLPAVNTAPDQHIGSILNNNLRFMIPATEAALALLEQTKRYQFIDLRIIPGSRPELINGLVIDSTNEAPQLYQKQEDGSWDLDTEVSKSIADFIDALCSARVMRWNAPYNEQQQWTSTLTIAIGEERLVLKKTDDHLIGIESRNVQGYLDTDSARDLFGE